MYYGYYDPMERMIEFGLGSAMARHMINTMNASMLGMYVPGAASTIPQPQSLTNIYVAIDKSPVGPLTEKEFGALVSQGKVSKDSLVWIPGMLSWKPLEEVPQVLKIVALTPPPLP